MKTNFKYMYSFLILTGLLIFASCSNTTEELSTDIENRTEVDAVANRTAKVKTYTANLSMLNESGASGMAELTLMGDQLTVRIVASGLEANQLHPQHIHGFSENNRNSTCPPPSADTNGDGFIDIPEGAPFYGGILLTLEPLPTASTDGTIDFEATYTLDGSFGQLQNRVIVLHGLTVGDTYWAGLPVACGQITASKNN